MTTLYGVLHNWGSAAVLGAGTITCAVGYLLSTQGTTWRQFGRKALAEARSVLADWNAYLIRQFGEVRVRKTPAVAPRAPRRAGAVQAAGLVPAPVPLAQAADMAPQAGAGTLSIWAAQGDPHRVISAEVLIFASSAWVQLAERQWAAGTADRIRTIRRQAALGEFEGDMLARFGTSMRPGPADDVWRWGDPGYLRRAWEDSTDTFKAIALEVA